MRYFLLLMVSALCSGVLAGAEVKRPNIIYILADDLGYGDLSCYGQKKFSTPNIDKLAESGMLFTQHYAGCPVCAPSRSSLMTGLHTGHTPIRGNFEFKGGGADNLPPEGQLPLPEKTLTVAHQLQKAGYRTGGFGKWGLGYPTSCGEPLKMGFDRFYGYNCQRMAHCYYPAFLWNDSERELLWGNVAGKDQDYAPELVQAEVLKFVRENKDRPFFCYYAAIQPHADMIAPERYMQKYRGKYSPESSYSGGYYRVQPEGKAAFVAMVKVLDDYVGELLGELDRLGLRDDTMVIFTSDNGPHKEGGHDPDFFDSNRELRGHKRDLYEGGIRVPLIASWPGKIEKGSTSDHVSAFWDFYPTVCELTGQTFEKEVDGISMAATLLGRGTQKQHKYLYWEFHGHKGRVAVRKGDWKAVRYRVAKDPDSPLELYHLGKDPGEHYNVAAEHPEVVKELNALIQGARTRSPEVRFNFPG